MEEIFDHIIGHFYSSYGSWILSTLLDHDKNQKKNNTIYFYCVDHLDNRLVMVFNDGKESSIGNFSKHCASTS